MKIWNLNAAEELSLDSYEPTALNETQNVKVRVEDVLLGRYDLSIYHGEIKGKYPLVFGKNAVGVVSETFSPESPFQKMNRVVIEPFIPCGQCQKCRDDDSADCANMQELGYNADGMLRDFVDLPESCLHKLPDIVSDLNALFVPYVAFCLNIIDKMQPEAGAHIAVFSSSKIGIIASQLLRYHQCVPIFVSDNEEAVQTAKNLGIFYSFGTESCDFKKEILVATGGRLCDKIIYFANSNSPIKDVVDCCATNATICIGGYNAAHGSFPLSQITKKHLNITGVYNGCGNFPSAINLVATNKVNLENLVYDTVSFDKLDSTLKKVSSADLGYKSLLVKID